mmetsp:Transcript_36834/g.87512  ORF Transcript_36834/g.87512 Transcript_36834/m.87512 type:complete len:292 (+) Transcript_36834:222-1097(+)
MVRVFEVGSRVLLAAPQRQQALPSHSLPARQAAARQEPAFRLAAQATAYADRAQANTADLRAATNTPYNTALTGERKSMLSGGEGSYAPQEHHKSHEDLWETVREETIENARHEPSLASSLHASILAHDSLGKMLAFILANKLQCSTLLGAHLMVLFQEAFADENIMDAVVADLNAVYDRDPACETYSQCILNFKGFQAIQAHRVSHWLWLRGRKALALLMQSRISEVFHVDIHPGAQARVGCCVHRPQRTSFPSRSSCSVRRLRDAWCGTGEGQCASRSFAPIGRLAAGS